MQLHHLKPRTERKSSKRVGRGGKRGTTSGGGTKGQKGRAGAGVRAGFRGGDNRIWQMFPKNRGASKKHGNKKPHRKHRLYQVRNSKPTVANLSDLNILEHGVTVTPEMLVEKGIIASADKGVKILSTGELKKKLTFKGFVFSESAKAKIEKAGGSIE